MSIDLSRSEVEANCGAEIDLGKGTTPERNIKQQIKVNVLVGITTDPPGVVEPCARKTGR